MVAGAGVFGSIGVVAVDARLPCNFLLNPFASLLPTRSIAVRIWLTNSPPPIASKANVAPVANAGTAQTVTRSSGTVTVTLTAAGSTDANSDTLTYAWTTAYQPPTSSIALSSATAVSPTFAATVAGVYVFNLIVNDGKVGSAVATVAITVN